jgi:citrate lyase beta subunit/acyl dehydratase
MNPLDSKHWEDDLEMTIQAETPHVYMVPKVQRADELQRISSHLDGLESKAGRSVGSTGLLPICTEVPSALFHMKDIATSSPRIVALTWGAEDLSAELGAYATKTKDGLYLDVFRFCRVQTLLAAKAAGVGAIDGPYTDIRDLKGLRAECDEAASSGFDGKLTIHPDHIAVANAAFTPSFAMAEEADELLAAFEASAQSGALNFKGKMVDMPHILRARRIADKARLAGVSAPPAAAESTQTTKSPGIQHGKWLEEFAEGQVIRHALTRTVTETDNMLFTTMSLNPAALHLDYEAAKATQFGKPLVNSMFTVALLVGMSVLETTHGTAVANLGFEEVMFPKPVFYGDTIHAETEVLAVRKSASKPTQGIVKMEHRAYNQHGELVCKARRNSLMRCRPA